MEAEHKLVYCLRNSCRRRCSVQVSKLQKLFMDAFYMRTKTSAVQIRVGNMWYFQRNCFIFNVKILKEVRLSENLLILLNPLEIFFTHSEAYWFRVHGLFRVTAFSITGSAEIVPGILIQIPQLWLVEWSCNGLKNSPKGLRDVKEGEISGRKAAQVWGLSMKKSTLQVRRRALISYGSWSD